MAGLDKGADAEKDEYYPYQLVKFFTKNKKGEADIDCVPSAWVTFNITTGKCECKYVPPPYDKDSFDLLHDFVKKQAPPPESWPSYPMTLQGRAKNYEEAMDRLNTLRVETYAYTTEEDISKADKAAATTKSYRNKVIKSNAKLTQKLLQVPRIRTSSEDSGSANASQQSNDFSNESSARESQDENENYWTDKNINRKETWRNDKENKDGRKKLKFPSDQDYMREVQKKSLRSLGKDATSKTPTADSSALRKSQVSGFSKKPSASLKRGSDASVPIASSTSQKGKDASVPIASSTSQKEKDASVLPVASSRSIDTNSDGVRTRSPEELPVVANKEIRGPILLAIESLRYDIQTMIKEFRDLKGVVQTSALAKDVFGANVQSFASEYEVSLPMKTMEDFKAFEDRLEKEKKFRKEFTGTLHYLVDSRTPLSRNITGILKKHLTRELALNFTAVKASKEKTIFKNTSFCTCMLEVARLKCKVIEKDTTIPITDKIYYQELGNALSNAFDWDGNWKQRSRRKPTLENPTEKQKETEKENVSEYEQ